MESEAVFAWNFRSHQGYGRRNSFRSTKNVWRELSIYHLSFSCGIGDGIGNGIGIGICVGVGVVVANIC